MTKLIWQLLPERTDHDGQGNVTLHFRDDGGTELELMTDFAVLLQHLTDEN